MIEDAATPSVRPGWFADPWDPGQLRYHDGLEWTGHVQPTLPIAGPAIQNAAGYPMAESNLILQAIPCPRDTDVACSLLNSRGDQIGGIRSLGRGLSELGRGVEDVVFEVVGINGAQRLLITRRGGFLKHHQVHVHDPAQNYLGGLRQTSSFWRQFRTPRLTMVLEYGREQLASTEVCIEPETQRFTDVQAPIHDTAGRVIATVYRRWRYVDTITDFFDYQLVCHHPVPHPLPELLLTTAFTHYLYDRILVGGLMGSYNRFRRGGTWRDPRGL